MRGVLFSAVWRRKFRILLFCALAAVAVALISVNSELSTATTYINLDFASANEGLTPSGTRLNIYDIKSQALLTEALEMTGLSDEMTWRELSACFTVAPSRTRSVSERYIATEYRATVTANERFGGVSARSMLDVICRLYYETFLSQSDVNHDRLAVDWAALSDMEYVEIADFIASRVALVSDLLQTRIDESAGYTPNDPSLSFRALYRALETFTSVSISKFSALVSQKNLFKDAAAYRNILTYRRLLLDQKYSLSRTQLSIRSQALQDYQESMIAIVMVPTYYQGDGMYMTRTQIGLDTLSLSADEYSASSQAQALEIAQIDEMLTSLSSAQTDEDGAAEALLASMALQYDALLETVLMADDAYVSYIARNHVTFTASEPGVMDAYNVKGALMAAAACFMVLGVLFALFDRHRQRRARP